MSEYPLYRFEAVFHDGKVLTFEGESPFQITTAFGLGSGVFQQIAHFRETPLNEATLVEQAKRSQSTKGDEQP